MVKIAGKEANGVGLETVYYSFFYKFFFTLCSYHELNVLIDLVSCVASFIPRG